MAQTKAQGSRSKSSGTSQAQKRTAASRSSSNGSSRSKSTPRSTSSNGKARSTSTSSAARKRPSSNGSSRTASSNGNGNGAKPVEAVTSAAQTAGHAGWTAVKAVGVPVVTAVAGAAAGAVLGRKRTTHKKKVLGIPVPGTSGKGVEGLVRTIGEAGRQFGHLAEEVKTTREKAEQVGKALT